MIEALAGLLAVSLMANWYWYKRFKRAVRRGKWNRKLEMVVESANKFGLEG